MSSSHSRHIAASEFKARCLALLDGVAETGETLIVTKRGKPVARILPVAPEKVPSLKGSILFEGDVLSPIGETWNAER